MNIPNGTSMSYNLGMHDVSGRTLLPQPLNQPSHLPKVWGFAKKGKANKPHLVVSDSRAMIFGLESFDPLKPWFNHATAFSNVFNAAGNAQMFERVLPPDAKPSAAVRLSLDLLPTLVQDYVRNSDGSYATDSEGDKIPTETKVAGHLGKWVAELIPLDEDGKRTFGLGTQKAGDQSDVVAGTTSQRYPIIDLEVSSEGAWGNDVGFSLWANTIASDAQPDTRLISDQKAYPFNMAVRVRPDALTTPVTSTTLSGAQSFAFVLKPGLIDRNFEAQMYLGDIFMDKYQNTKTRGVSPTYGDFGRIRVYEANLASVLGMVYDAEYLVSESDVLSDFDGSADEQYRFNLVSAVSSSNSPYHTFQLITGAPNSVRLTESAVIYARDGSDGTMTNDVFDTIVRTKLADYGNKNSQLQDSVNNPENIFWDSGFSLATKKAMANFIAIRKGTYVMASTHVVDGPELTADQELSVAISLVTAFQNFPESTYYATPTVRASIIAGSGTLLSSKYLKPLPLSYDRAAAWSAYMGASNGKWIAGKKPDVSPLNIVTTMAEINVVFRPTDSKYKDWDAGLVWADPYSMDQPFFGQFQTVYTDDTSVLNSAINAFANVTLVAVAEKAHRDNTGRSDLTKDQMAESINNNILAQVLDKYDGRFIIIPETTYTADDDRRGYSWSTKIKVGAPMMQTVQTLTIESYRKEDLQAQSA